MAIFGVRPWVNPFGKMSSFPRFQLLVFIAQKGVFSFQIIVKIFPLLLLPKKKKKLEKWSFLYQNHGLTLLKNVNFSTVWISCFCSVEKRFFVLEYSKRHFPGFYCLKQKSWKNGHFIDQKLGLTPLEKCQFFELLNCLFLYPRKAFFPSRIS